MIELKIQFFYWTEIYRQGKDKQPFNFLKYCVMTNSGLLGVIRGFSSLSKQFSTRQALSMTPHFRTPEL